MTMGEKMDPNEAVANLDEIEADRNSSRAQAFRWFDEREKREREEYERALKKAGLA